ALLRAQPPAGPLARLPHRGGPPDRHAVGARARRGLGPLRGSRGRPGDRRLALLDRARAAAAPLRHRPADPGAAGPHPAHRPGRAPVRLRARPRAGPPPGPGEERRPLRARLRPALPPPGDLVSSDDRLLPETWGRPVLGVLGGMGPAATVAFLDALVRATPASRDQDHIDTVVLGHASVPDRTARLLDPGQPDPTPYLLGDLELLARLGATRAVIACNTSHAFLPKELPLPLLSLVRVGAEAAVDRA